jgi:enoyl-[acyl-carrier protein] reductase II
LFSNNRICTMLGIPYPIVLGGMAWLGDAQLAAAVSNAGGLGIVAAGSMPPDMLEEQVKKTKTLTNKPFGVNLVVWETFFKDQLQVVIEEQIQVITTGVSDPRPLMERIKGHDILVIPVVPTARLAKRMESAGAHAVVASGSEGGGHVGRVSTLITVQKTVQTVNIPVLAAGGFCDAKGLVAALALGASGIQMGTRFIVAKECKAHEKFKNKIILSTEEDTVVTGEYTGAPMRVIKNRFTDYWLNAERNQIDKDELRKQGLARVRIGACEGNVEDGSLPSGQVIGLINEEKSVKEIVDELILEAGTIIDRLHRDYYI